MDFSFRMFKGGDVECHTANHSCDIFTIVTTFFKVLSAFYKYIWQSQAGGTRQALTKEMIENFEIPLLSIKDQCRIAARLKSQFTAIEDARNAIKTQLDEFVNLANGIIRQSVEHPDTGSASMGDVLDEVKKGIGKTWGKYPVWGATRVGLALAKEPVGKIPERYKPVTNSTVFYNPMRIMIGSIAMVDEDDTPGITSPDYVALRGMPGLVDSRWFYYWLRSPYGVSCIASLARGSVRERMLFNRLAEINLLPTKILAKAFDIAIKISVYVRGIAPGS
ncbi:MAG: restriction endonuclease subunit S [Steroidobacteraceae bacterium]|nr:restriction endonuclease subunit S [Deltaproteobacteria bacterium]